MSDPIIDMMNMSHIHMNGVFGSDEVIQDAYSKGLISTRHEYQPDSKYRITAAGLAYYQRHVIETLAARERKVSKLGYDIQRYNMGMITLQAYGMAKEQGKEEACKIYDSFFPTLQRMLQTEAQAIKRELNRLQSEQEFGSLNI